MATIKGIKKKNAQAWKGEIYIAQPSSKSRPKLG
jgi:hypothetical protein